MSWIYNEYKHCGVDYSDENEAEKYDSQHQNFRNYEAEFQSMLEFLELSEMKEMNVIDLGCGTGASSIYGSKFFKKIYGVDVSKVMIEQAKKKAVNENITNIEFINEGFLTYNHNGAADLVITKAALHHLPDFWKQIALFKMNKMLKDGGLLYIFDIVFNMNGVEYKNKIDKWVVIFDEKVGKEFKEEVETHIRDEYSTFDWILEEMLRKAGFEIKNKRSIEGFVTEYCCIKRDEIEFEE